MKQFCSFTLILAMLVCAVGCHQESSEPEEIAFYYCVSQPDYSIGSTALAPEYRGGVPQDSLHQTLELYLSGPLSSDLQSPFPQDLKLVGVNQNGSTIQLTFSPELATLTGLDLTIACGCLTLTTLALTSAQQVEIRTVSGLLDGQRTITMDKNTLLLLDTAQDEGE